MITVNSFIASDVNLAHVWKLNSHQLCFIFAADDYSVSLFFSETCFCACFTEAGVILQNKSLKVQYELLTASGLNASLSSVEIRKEVL